MHRLAALGPLLLLTILPASTASAGPTYWTDGGRIAAALHAGEIDETDALWLGYLTHFEPGQLPLAFRGETRPGWHCATGLVMALERSWDDFSSEQQAQMAPRVRPLAAVTPPPPPPPETLEDNTCWGQYGEHRVVGDHFAVEWDGNTVSEGVAENFLEALETSWEVEVEELGWRAPEGSDDYLMFVFVDDSDWGGAYTTVDMCNGDLLPYIVASSGSFQGGTWYQDMAAHEFNHSMQFGYSFAHEFWWWEATATYIEDDVYPTHESWSPYVSGYTQNPWMAMNTNSDTDYDRFMHMYGMAIFGFYLDQHVGGEDIVRQTWAATEGSHEQYSTTLEDLAEELEFDWDEAYQGFMVANTVMDYDDHQYYPTLDIERTVGALPTDGESAAGSTPETHGQNYVRFDTDEALDDEPDLWIEFEGDEDGQWIVVLVGTEDDEVIEVVSLDVEDGVGAGRLEGFGDFDRAYMVVSPTRNSNSSFEYSWSAETIEALPEEDDDDEGDDDTTLHPGDGCQCDQVARRPLAGALAAPLALASLFLLRRRARC